MEWTPEKLRKVRALLDENSAVLVQFSDVEYAASNGQGAAKRKYRKKLVRRWPRISDGNRAICEAYLAEYGSAANTEPSRTITDPKADREIYAGTWRKTRNDLSRIRTDPQEQGVYQTLLFPADASDGPDGTYSAEETHLNHVHVVASTGDAPAGIACQVPAKGKRLSVTAHLDKESGEWESEVRTDEARQEKWEHTDGDAFSTTRHIRKEHAKVLSFPAPAPGKIVRTHADIDEYGTYRTQADETTAVPFGPKDYKSGDNALQTSTTEIARNADAPPAAGPNETVSARPNEFGKWDWERHTATPKPAEARTEAAEWTEKTTSLAYRNADAEKNAIDGVADPHAIVPSANAHRNELGKVDGSVQVTVPVPQQSGPHAVEQTALRKVESTFHFNKESVPAATSANGTATTYHPRVNKFGLIDYEERKTSPGSQGKNAWKQIHIAEWWTERVYTMEFRNWTDVPKKEDFGAHDPLADKGVLSNHNVNFNDLDLFDGYLVLTVPVEQESPEVVIEDTDLRKITVRNFFNKRTAPPAASSSDNTIVTHNAQQNRFGLWDYETRTTTLKRKEGSQYTAEKAYFETTTVQQKLNQTAPENAEAQTGAVATVHNRLNEVGGYDIEKRTEKAEAKQSAAVVVEKTPERTVTVQHFHNQSGPPSGATHSNGVSTLFSGVQLNRFGLYDYEKRIVEDKGAMGDGYSYTYNGPYSRGVKSRTTIRTSKGNTYELLEWGQWRNKYTVNVAKHTSIAAAKAALNGKNNVHSAHITEGGSGIWYSHLITVTKEWT